MGDSSNDGCQYLVFRFIFPFILFGICYLGKGIYDRYKDNTLSYSEKINTESSKAIINSCPCSDDITFSEEIDFDGCCCSNGEPTQCTFEATRDDMLEMTLVCRCQNFGTIVHVDNDDDPTIVQSHSDFFSESDQIQSLSVEDGYKPIDLTDTVKTKLAWFNFGHKINIEHIDVIQVSTRTLLENNVSAFCCIRQSIGAERENALLIYPASPISMIDIEIAKASGGELTETAIKEIENTFLKYNLARTVLREGGSISDISDELRPYTEVTPYISGSIHIKHKSGKTEDVQVIRFKSERNR